MMLTTQKIFIAIAIVCLIGGGTVSATIIHPLETGTSTITAVGADGTEIELVRFQEGGQLPNTANYEWWYGCSPTSAGMIMGYYDRNGYDGSPYNNLVPGEAESSTFPSTPGDWSYNAQSAIASPGHVSDFYSGGYGASNDDVSTPTHEFDSLADFMGTSQDNLSSLFSGNPNGATSFWYNPSNLPLYESDLIGLGPDYYNLSGMCGIGEYLEYSGYDADVLYNQFIYGYDDIPEGFTLDQYKAEIDAGRPVLIHVEGHSMVGYGYVDDTDTINVYDTWAPNGQNPGTMTWGGSYPYGATSLQHYAVTVLTPVPEPTTLLLLLMGGAGLLRHRRK
jgi:hypothetical protein